MDANAPPRPVRSYVLREGRMTPAQRTAFAQLWSSYGVDFDPERRLEPERLFRRVAPVTLEIGFGNGAALSAMAARHPQRNFLGIEVHRPGVGQLLMELRRQGLDNVRVMRHDFMEILRHNLTYASLDAVLLFFPDPWPKRKHHKRRLVQALFATEMARVIRPGGRLHMATDWQDYAAQMLSVVDAVPELVNTVGPGRFAARPDERPLTRFELRGQRLGHGVWDLIYRHR